MRMLAHWQRENPAAWAASCADEASPRAPGAWRALATSQDTAAPQAEDVHGNTSVTGPARSCQATQMIRIWWQLTHAITSLRRQLRADQPPALPTTARGGTQAEVMLQLQQATEALAHDPDAGTGSPRGHLQGT